MVKYSGMRKRCSMTFKESNCIRPKYEEAGFTLSELLIVVAIIAVLVAISIPIFTNQLEKARESTDASNIRSAYAEIATALVSGDLNYAAASEMTVSGGKKATVTTTLTNATGDFKVTVDNGKAKQGVAQWQSGDQEIAGYTLSATTDMKDTTKIVYTFTVTATNTYLSKIEFE